MTGRLHIFRNLTGGVNERKRFEVFAEQVTLWVGHNVLNFDFPVLNSLLGTSVDIASVCDTLIVSRLIDYPRDGHSIENYGREFGLEKKDFNDFKQWSQEMEDYCIRDVDICEKVYLKYKKYLDDPKRKQSILLEHKFQLIVNALENNGFAFNADKAGKLLTKVSKELGELDEEILQVFPPRPKLVREITPKHTQHGTLNRSDFRWVSDGDLSIFNGGPFSRISWENFNPASHKQLVDVLNAAGWQPVDRTQTHIDTEREINRRKYSRKPLGPLDVATQELYDDLERLRKSGWKINENNLSTLPASAPAPARTLAARILLESRRRSLTEWLGLVREDGRIHGDFQGIGAWTHRMSHQKPNTANIPSEYKLDGSVKLLGKEMRQLWCAAPKRLLVGVDAEGIQLRIFAHYIDDKEFTEALVNGKKTDKTDPHSLNQRILGRVCKSRGAAKRFIYALLLGAGIDKLAVILECSREEAEEALARLIQRYQGFDLLKREVIPSDAKRGWFEGIDGRAVRIPGDGVGERRHLCMSGYLQNGEAVVMKTACLLFEESTVIKDLRKEHDILFVDIVHDEVQIEVPNNMQIALTVAETFANCIKEAGVIYQLKCPLAGSYWNEDHNDYTIGTNWYQTH